MNVVAADTKPQAAVDTKTQPAVLDVPPLDLSVPESPAFTVLGVTPQDVVRPSTLQEFGATVLNATDDKGNLQSGIALETNPYPLFKGAQLSLKDYQDPRNWHLRLLARLRTSVATTKASGSDTAERAAVGVVIVPWDTGDPRLDPVLTKCINDALSFGDAQPVPIGEPGKTTVTVLPAPTLKVIAACRSDFQERVADYWATSSWMIGAAPTWISDTGAAKKLSADGGGIWTSLAIGINKDPQGHSHSQMILHARYRSNEQVKGSDSKYFGQDSQVLGARYRFGVPQFAGSIEASYVAQKPDGKPKDTFIRLIFGAERKVGESLWIQLALGREFDRTKGANGFVARSGFQYKFAQKSKYE